jgi:Uma2 family endonuclease
MNDERFAAERLSALPNGMVPAPAAGRATLAEFLACPESDPPSEFVDGRVVERPPPTGPELWLRADLTALLYGWARASHLGAVAAVVRCTFGGNSYLPDLVYYAPEHRPAGSADAVGALTTPPDFVAEICPSSVDLAWVGHKLARMVADGVRLAWLIDPAERTATVYRPGQAPLALRSGGMLDGADVLPRFYVFLDDLFEVLDEEG